MRNRERRKMKYLVIFAVLTIAQSAFAKSIQTIDAPAINPTDDNFENNIIDFDEDYSLKLNKKYGAVPWDSIEKFNKNSHKYTLVKDDNKINKKETKTAKEIVEETTPNADYSVIPLELVSTTENILISILESTTEDLTVIPLSTTKKSIPDIEIKESVTLPSSTQSSETSTEYFLSTTEDGDKATTVSENIETTTTKRELAKEVKEIKGSIASNNSKIPEITPNVIVTTESINNTGLSTNVNTTVPVNETKISDRESGKPKTTNVNVTKLGEEENVNKNVTKDTSKTNLKVTTKDSNVTTILNNTKIVEVLKANSSKQIDIVNRDFDTLDSNEDIDSFSDLDVKDDDVPEDYYDSKDVVPTTAPKTDALSVIFGLAGSVVESMVESVAERVVPKGIYDLFKRMQRQSEALEAERLRSREENGGIGQFTRGIIKSISTGLSKPLSQLMAGVQDIGSLDSDRGFVSSLASGVTSAANSVVDMFKDRVQAIYPGTVWCGDGHSAQARSSSDLGLFFFTDTCCRQHDACKIYIKAGETKYGLTNTGLFTRSHCSCDAKFRDCLRKTNSLVSAQIGLTYFNVLGPQCFRKAHPIVRCVRKTRITGQKCEEYELDFTKPKMWQWFDNETF